MQIPCPFGAPGRGGRPKGENLVKMVEFRGIPSILVNFTKKAPETAFLVKTHPETHFSVPGTPKGHGICMYYKGFGKVRRGQENMLILHILP